MNKYEIMMILAPSETEKPAKTLLESVFGAKNIEKFEVMEKTELAYEINKSKTAKYILALVNSDPVDKKLNEFVRRVNIEKKIWRHMVVNLSSERGLGKPNTPRPQRKRNDDQDRTKREFHKKRETPGVPAVVATDSTPKDQTTTKTTVKTTAKPTTTDKKPKREYTNRAKKSTSSNTQKAFVKKTDK